MNKNSVSLLFLFCLSFSYSQDNIKTEIKILKKTTQVQYDTLKIISFVIDHLDSISTDTKLFARLLNYISFNYIKLEKYKKAELYVEKALDHNGMFPEELAFAEHNMMCIEIINGDMDSAFYYHKRSFKDAPFSLKEHFDECKFVNDRLSTEYYNKFLNYALKTRQDGESWKLWKKAKLFYDQKKYKKAKKYFDKAIKYEKKNLNRSSVVNHYYTGQYSNYADWGKNDKIIELLNNHLNYISKDPNYEMYFEAYSYAAVYYTNFEESDLLIRSNYTNQATKYANKIQDYRFIIDQNQFMGLLLSNGNKNKKSLGHNFEALKYSRYFANYPEGSPTLYEDKYYAPIGEIYLGIGKIYVDLQNFDLAIAYLDSAKHIFIDTQQDSLLVITYNTLSETYFNNSDFTNMVTTMDLTRELCQNTVCEENDLYWSYLLVALKYIVATDWPALIKLSNEGMNVNNYKLLDDFTYASGNLFTKIFLGMSYCMLGNEELCKETFNSAYELEKTFNGTWFEYMNSTEQIEGTRDLANFMFGLTEFFKNDFKKAIFRLEKVMKSKYDENNLKHTAQNLLTNAYLLTNQIKKAEKSQNKTKKFFKNHQELSFYNKYIQNGLSLIFVSNDYSKLDEYLPMLENTVNQQFKKEGHLNNQFKDLLIPNYETVVALQLIQENWLSASKFLEMSKAQNFKYKIKEKHKVDISNNPASKIDSGSIFIGIDLLSELGSPAGEAITNMNYDVPHLGGKYSYYLDWLLVQMYFPYSSLELSRYNALFYAAFKDSSFIEDYTDTRNTVKTYNYELKKDLDFHQLSNRLYNYLINPIMDTINTYNNIVFMPDNNFALLPFETLIDNNGRYLIESFNISYNQTLDTYGLINSKNIDFTNNSLIAFSDPDYSTNNSNDYHIINKYRSTYSDLGYDQWSPLPGTSKEVESISKIFPDIKILNGANANEKTIKALSESNELEEYSIIHFATHGLLVTDKPELNALILSQNELSTEDGYLRSEEIEALNINAELVVLSACETAVGESYYSEGIVGLTNSFFIAGAKAVVSTLWPVDDQATAIFMNSFYRNMKNTDNNIFALANTKREFIRGDHGDEYKKPYYWAPFVYYGK